MMADEELLQAGGSGLGLLLEFGTSLGLGEKLWAGGYLGLSLGLDLGDELGLGLELEWLAGRNGHIL